MVVDMILPEIEQHNHVTRKNFVIPFYDTTKVERRLQLYFNNSGELLMMGWAGDQYVFWLSITRTDDVELNERIFYHVSYEKLQRVTTRDKALAAINISNSDLEGYYLAELKCKLEMQRKKENIPTWETPFGHEYEKEQAEQNGAVFAKDVQNYVSQIYQWCELRECDGHYKAVLELYASELKETEEYSSRVQLLQELLKSESYLILASNEEIRGLYRYCCAKCRELQCEDRKKH